MHERLVRYADLMPRVVTPTTDRTRSAEGEVFNILGGVSGDARSRNDFAEPYPVAMDAVRQVGRRARAPYTHAGAEVFVAHTGRWRLQFGPNGEDGAVHLAPGDVASVCPGAFRCFDKPDDEPGCLLIFRGSADPLPEPEPSSVFTPAVGARRYRMPRWIDTSSGVPVLKDADVTDGPSLRRSAARALGGNDVGYVAATDVKSNALSLLTVDGVEEAGLIVPCATRDRFEAGPSGCGWPHGFNLRLLILQSGAYLPLHTRAESELLFVQEGAVEIQWPDGAIMMGAGDTLSIPIGVARALRNTTSGSTRIFVIRGSEDPHMPVFLSMPPHGETSTF